MKHLDEAQKLVSSGDGHAALAVVDGVLALAPRNPEALRLKAQILEAWGHFDESLAILRGIAEAGALTVEGREQLANHLREEREFLLFSVLAPDGRWYFAMPHSQVKVSWYGLLGCFSFLLLAGTQPLTQPAALPLLLAAFFFLVLLPWLALMVVFLIGVKKVFVGLDRLEIHTRFKERAIPWEQVRSAVIQYDPDPCSDFLRLALYGENRDTGALVEFDISEGHGVVRARRHFLRHVLSQVDVVSWCPRNAQPAEPQPESSDKVA